MKKNICRECYVSCKRKYYEKNKEIYKLKNKERYARRKIQIKITKEAKESDSEIEMCDPGVEILDIESEDKNIVPNNTDNEYYSDTDDETKIKITLRE